MPLALAAEVAVYRTDAAGVMMDDIWAGIFAAGASILAAGLSHGVM